MEPGDVLARLWFMMNIAVLRPEGHSYLFISNAFMPSPKCEVGITPIEGGLDAWYQSALTTLVLR